MSKMTNDNRGRSPVKFKINQQENSKRLLNTSKLQFKHLWKYKELAWLIKYLQQEGKTEEEIFLIWRKCYIANFGDYYEEDDFKREYFKIKHTILKNMGELFVGSEIVFFKEEIDIINSIVCPLWVKEYYLVLLGYFKFIGAENKYISLGNIPRNTLLTYFTSKKKQGDYETQAIYSFAQRNDLFSVSEDGKVLLKYSRKEGKEILKLNTSADLKEVCSFVKNTKKCSLCGEEFEYGSHCQRSVCFDCWKKKDKIKRNETMKNRYNSDKHLLFLK